MKRNNLQRKEDEILKSHFLGIANTEKSPYLCTQRFSQCYIRYLFSYYEYRSVVMTGLFQFLLKTDITLPYNSCPSRR